MVFEVMYMGTGYDIAEALIGMAKKTHINIWKYSKNVVKLNVLKVER
jgi:type III secretion system FlhB-like substrate exporter